MSVWMWRILLFILISGVFWFIRWLIRRKKQGKQGLKPKGLRIPPKLREKKVFIPLIVVLVILMAIGTWWFVSSRQADSPDDMIVKNDKLIAKEIYDNYKGEIALSEFKERMEKRDAEHRLKKVYRQYREKEYGSMVKYWVQFAGDDGYYLVHATPGEQVLIDTALGKSAFPLDTELSTGERVFYGQSVYYKLLTTVPRAPFPKEQIYILIGTLLFFSLIFYFIFWRGGLGSGKFGKARTQDIKKPVYFADVGGIDEALEESREVVRMIKGED